eukprot:4373087-Amphidinium_carterae.1
MAKQRDKVVVLQRRKKCNNNNNELNEDFHKSRASPREVALEQVCVIVASYIKEDGRHTLEAHASILI